MPHASPIRPSDTEPAALLDDPEFPLRRARSDFHWGCLVTCGFLTPCGGVRVYRSMLHDSWRVTSGGTPKGEYVDLRRAADRARVVAAGLPPVSLRH